MTEVIPSVLAEANVPATRQGLLSQFSPIYALFPPGSSDDPPPSESKLVDYQPVPVEAFLERAIAVPRFTSNIVQVAEVVSLLLTNLGLRVSPVIVSLAIGSLVGVILWAASGSAIWFAFSVAFVLLPHITVHLPNWPGAVKALQGYLKEGGLGAEVQLPFATGRVFTFPHQVWPRNVWQMYGGAKLAVPFVIYGREHHAEDGSTALQYWAYYLFNDWANRHESDWEVVTLLIPPMGKKPSHAVYSVHESACVRRWPDTSRLDDAGHVSKSGAHPLVYVAVGSHAQYFERRPDGYLAHLSWRTPTGNAFKLGSAPTDRRHIDLVVDVAARQVAITNQYELRILPDWAPGDAVAPVKDTVPWLAWPGRWGRESGPLGPAFQGTKWTQPSAWARSLEDTDCDDVWAARQLRRSALKVNDPG